MKGKNTVKLRDFLSENFWVYFCFDTRELALQFLREAAGEGLILSGDIEPTKIDRNCLLILGSDGTISLPKYSGVYSAMAFHSQLYRDGKLIVKIDYRKLRNGDRDYIRNAPDLLEVPRSLWYSLCRPIHRFRFQVQHWRNLCRYEKEVRSAIRQRSESSGGASMP